MSSQDGISSWVAAVIGASGAGLAALGAYFTTRRKTSGSIATTEAETLWTESQNMRQELRDEVVALRAQIAAGRAETEHWRNESQRLGEEIFSLRKQLQYAQAELEDIHRTRLRQEGVDGS